MTKNTNLTPICNCSVNSKRDIRSILFLIFLFPTFWGYMSIGKGQILYLFATFLIICILIFYRQYKIRFPIIGLSLFTILSLCYFFTLSINSFLPQSSVSFKDFSDVARPIFYLFFFSLPYIIGFSVSDTKYLIKTYLIIVTGILVFDIIKFIPIFYPILRLYTLFEVESLNYSRFAGTFCFCYNFGFASLLGLAFCLYSKFKFKYLTIIIYVLLFVLIGSRSVMIACVALLLGYYFWAPGFFRKIIAIPIVVISCVLLYNILINIDIPIITDSINYAERLVDALSGTAQDGSLNTRSSQLSRVLNLFDRNPLIGNGPIKDDDIQIEIQLGYYLSAWGLLGTFVFLSIIAVFFYWANSASSSHNPIISNFSKANRLWIIASFFVGMSTPITDQMRVFQIFDMMQGVQYILYRNRNS